MEIVDIDETGWKVGEKSCDTWIFSTSMHVLFCCGVSRKKIEATVVLGDSFVGIGVTDDHTAHKTNFALANMLDEIHRWTTAGVSLFQSERDILKTNIPPPTPSTADS